MFKFNASKITTKNNFDILVELKKNILKQSKDKLFNEYAILNKEAWDRNIEKYEQFRIEYRIVVHSILLDVITHYREFLPEKCLIAEFGSFVKGTERIYSDFDFTICYDEPKIEQYEVAEELIDYSLAAIFEYSIDHVHGKFQHYPDMPDMYTYTENDNHYRLVFEDGFIDYKCGPGTLNDNLMHIKNVRDYNSMITGYEEKYKYKCNIDCLYSIEILENTTDHDFLGDLAAFEKKYDICDGYVFDLAPYKLEEQFRVSEIKSILKAKGVVEFYIFIATLRKKIGFHSKYSMNISDLWKNQILLSFFGKEYIDELHKSFVEFIFLFNRIELSLTKRGIPLSTRCHSDFTAISINQLLAEDWVNSTDIEIIIDARNKLASIVQEGLRLLEERF